MCVNPVRRHMRATVRPCQRARPEVIAVAMGSLLHAQRAVLAKGVSKSLNRLRVKIVLKVLSKMCRAKPIARADVPGVPLGMSAGLLPKTRRVNPVRQGIDALPP